MGVKLFLLSVVAFLLIGAARSNLETTVPQVIDQFWTLASGGTGSVDTLDLEIFYKRYENVLQTRLLVIESWFISGPDSWVSDFAVTAEVARAYFRLLDDYWWEYVRDNTQRINLRDCEYQVIVGDTDLSTDLSEAEFKSGFNRLLFDRMPFSLLFVRFGFFSWNFDDYNEFVNQDEFRNIFNAIDTDATGDITIEEMASYWESGGYGSRATGEQFFNATLTNPSAPSISLADWDSLFSWLAYPVIDQIMFEDIMCLQCLLAQYRTNPGQQYTLCEELDADLDRFRCKRVAYQS